MNEAVSGPSRRIFGFFLVATMSIHDFLGCLLLPVRFMHPCSAVQGMSQWSRLGANAGYFGLRNEEFRIPVTPD